MCDADMVVCILYRDMFALHTLEGFLGNIFSPELYKCMDRHTNIM